MPFKQGLSFYPASLLIGKCLNLWFKFIFKIVFKIIFKIKFIFNFQFRIFISVWHLYGSGVA